MYALSVKAYDEHGSVVLWHTEQPLTQDQLTQRMAHWLSAGFGVRVVFDVALPYQSEGV